MVDKKCHRCGETKSLDQFHNDKSNPDGHFEICKICNIQKVREWYRQNREKVLAYQFEYNNAHKIDKQTYDQRYRANNKEKCLKRASQWVANNREARKVITKRYRDKYKDRLSEEVRTKRLNNIDEYRVKEQHKRDRNRTEIRRRLREWKRNNRQKVRVDTENRRAKKAGMLGKFSHEDIQRLYFLQDGVCIYHELNPNCLVDLNFAFHIDHIIPIFRDGTNNPDNLQLLCHFCNESKGMKTDQEYRDWLARVYPK